MSKRVVFFGNERLATGLPATPAITLTSLIEAGYDIVGVVTRPDKHPSAVEAVAQSHGIPIIDIAAEFKADIGVLVAYGLILPENIINQFPRGIVNIHPSRLPIYRGSTPIEQAILDDLKETAVSLMQLTSRMDAGPVYAQQSVEIPPGISKFALADQLIQIGAKLLISSMPGILDGSLAATPQEESAATYTPQIIKADGVIDWQKPADRLAREIIAYLGWPGSRTGIHGRDVTVTDAKSMSDSPSTSIAPGTIIETESSQLKIAAGNGSVLEICRLKPAGKSEMSAADFLRGLR